MKLSYEDHGHITVLSLNGELTADQSDAFRRSCQDRFDAGSRDVLLQVKDLSLVDSAGLELLLWLSDEVAHRSGQLRLIGCDETVRKILEITRLERRFAIHDTVEAAAKSLRA